MHCGDTLRTAKRGSSTTSSSELIARRVLLWVSGILVAPHVLARYAVLIGDSYGRKRGSANGSKK